MTEFPSLASLANRVRALRRKLYRPRHEVLLGRHVNQLCEEWADAQSQDKPFPDPHDFIRRVADSGFRFLPSPAPSATSTTAAAAKRSPATNYSSTPSSPGVNPLSLLTPSQPKECPKKSKKVPAP